MKLAKLVAILAASAHAIKIGGKKTTIENIIDLFDTDNTKSISMEEYENTVHKWAKKAKKTLT